MSETGENKETNDQAKKPWPLSWVLIAILAYIALQTAYLLFVAD